MLSAILEVIIHVFHKQISDFNFVTDFEEPTKLFSQSQVPLIADVLPMLDSIEQSMTLVCDDEDMELPNVVRVAAQAVLLLIDKYYLSHEGL